MSPRSSGGYSQQDDPVMTRALSARFRPSTGSAPRPDHDVPGDPPAPAPPMGGQDRGDLVGVWRQAAVVVAAWLIILGLALLALFRLAQPPAPASPTMPTRSEIVAPGLLVLKAQQPGPRVEITR